MAAERPLSAMTAPPSGPETILSVVIPVLDEAESLPELRERLRKALPARSEIIVVDDGSTDGSGGFLESWAAGDPGVRLIRFRENFGKTAALAAAFSVAHGSWIAVLDADLQNDPADIPRLLAKAEEGYDVVSGWRRTRKDPLFAKVLPSRVANWLVSRVTGLPLHDYGCALKVYRREVLRGLSLGGDMHRLLPAYLFWTGAKIAEVEIRHAPRRFGVSHYGWERIPKTILDLAFFVFLRLPAARPFLLAGGIGAGLILASLGAGAWMVSRSTPGDPAPPGAMVLSAWLLAATGAILLTAAVLAARAARRRFRTVDPPYHAAAKTGAG